MSQPQSRKAFLVVDDDSVWIRLATRSLEPYAPVMASGSLAEARALLIREGRPTGVILDLELPDGSGFELLRELRKAGYTAPALILTSHTQGEFLREAGRLRAEFVRKPPDESQLAQFARRSVSYYWTEDERVGWLVDELARREALTPREVEILAAGVAGLPRELLAEDLGISTNTLKSQIRRLLLKCRVKTLDELARQVLTQALAGSGLGR
ncbi:MAG: response regulator transcription factor [Polyangiaceae bacterium]|nr:response regulator transcription factor [Polyangiaceae bacterium]MCW5791587.1 response regulator transcription factor [Polyangiaceae bacterium]